MPPDDPLDAIAAAILDGTPVDWASVEGPLGDVDPLLTAQLRTLARVRAVARTPEAAADSRPETWGHLRVLERVGQGAFGQVYRGWDTRLDREIALKLMPAATAGQSAGSSIIEEGRLLARVRHPNVVTIHGAERIGDRVGLSMEFVDGQTLEELLRAGRRFTAAEAMAIAVGVCRAVAAVHAAGLLHRDIKAQNVMIADDGRIVLMDFGAGHELEAASQATARGTPLYLAPEILAGGAASVRSDVYSIGVLLHHVLTDSYPVRAGDLRELRHAHARLARANVRGMRPDVPRRLARAIDRAVDPDPGRRFQSATELGDVLESVRGAPRRRRAAYATAIAVGLMAAAWIGRDFATHPANSGGSPAAPAASAVVPGAATPVMAVLPFKNLSSEADSDDFVDGLTGEIIRNLAVIDGLDVRSQTSSFFFKGKPHHLADIGAQLAVDYLVEGTAQLDGRRLRVTAQLVRVDGDLTIWSETFDRPLEDVFAIQDEVSRAIVNKLRLTLGRGQRRYHTNVEAYALYLRARAVIARRGTRDARAAAALFEQAIAKDASFAPAYAGLTDAYAFMSTEIRTPQNPNALLPAEALRRMRPAALKAIDLDPLLSEAHAAMGLTYSREREWTKASESFRHALELNPSLTQTYTNYSTSTLIALGRLDEAEELMRTALRNDPLSLAVPREIAMLRMIRGRYDEALPYLRRIHEADPEFPFVALFLAQSLTFSGRLSEAWPMWESRKHAPGFSFWMAPVYVMAGRRAEAERLLDVHEHPFRRAVIYAALGDANRTLDALNRAADVMPPHRVANLLATPQLAFLHADPRLSALRTKLKLPVRYQ